MPPSWPCREQGPDPNKGSAARADPAVSLHPQPHPHAWLPREATPVARDGMGLSEPQAGPDCWMWAEKNHTFKKSSNTTQYCLTLFLLVYYGGSQGLQYRKIHMNSPFSWIGSGWNICFTGSVLVVITLCLNIVPATEKKVKNMHWKKIFSLSSCQEAWGNTPNLIAWSLFFRRAFPNSKPQPVCKTVCLCNSEVAQTPTYL